MDASRRRSRGTLVVHSIGFRDDLWLDSNGDPLTSTGMVSERISRPNFGTLIVEMTTEDPQGFPYPMQFVQTVRGAPHTSIV